MTFVTVSLLIGFLSGATNVAAQDYQLADTILGQSNGFEFGHAMWSMDAGLIVGAPGGGAVYLVDASSGDILQTFTNPNPDPDPAEDSHFGWSVAGAGNMVLISAPWQDTGAENAGTVYLFDTVGNVLHVIHNPDPDYMDRFGHSVAIVGTKLIVGTPGEDQGGEQSGVIYVYDRDTGTLLDTIYNPAPTISGGFGNTLEPTGSQVLVGATWNEEATVKAGVVYLIDLGSGNVVQTFSDPDPAHGGEFGWSIAAANGRVCVGARGAIAQREGTVYLFDAGNGNLLHSFKSPQPVAQDRFGRSVAFVADKILVGEPYADSGSLGEAHLYSSLTFAHMQSFPPPGGTKLFGYSVALVDEKVAVGALLDGNGGSEAGAVYIYQMPVLAPEIAVSHSTISFGSLESGSTGNTVLSISNSGQATLSVTDIFSSDAQFSATPTTFTVAPVNSQDVTVTFAPSSVGPKSAILSVTSNDPDEGTLTVSLSGNGVSPPPVPTPDISLTSGSLSFGDVRTGESSSLSVSITNGGTADLSITGIASSDAQFVPSLTAFVVTPGSTQSVGVVFTPSSVGSRSGILTVISNDPDEGTLTVALSGTGTAPPSTPVPDISLSDSTVAFGTIVVGQSTSRTLTVSNSGNQDLVINGLSTSTSANGNTFSPSPTGAVRLAPGENQVVTVSYSPVAVGNDKGALGFHSNDPDEGTIVVLLTASAVAPDVELSALDIAFGDVETNQSGTRMLIVRNTGNSVLDVNEIKSSHSQFSVDTTFFSLPADSSRILLVSFTPSAEGPVAGTLLVKSNDHDEAEAVVNVSGFGVSGGSPPRVVTLTVRPEEGGRIQALLPRFWWTAEDEDGESQAAWQVQVGSEPGVKDDDLWDSGKQDGQRLFVDYDGGALEWNRVYGVRVRLWDPTGLVSTWKRFIFETLDNRPPTVRIDSPEDGTIALWDPIAELRFSGTAQDGDEGGVRIDSILWMSSLDGILKSGTSSQEANFKVPMDQLSIGDHVITLSAWDDEGDSSSAQVDLTVEGLPPVAHIDSVLVNGTGLRTLIVRAGMDTLTFLGSDADLDEYGDSILVRTWSYSSESEGYASEHDLGEGQSLGMVAGQLPNGWHRVYYRVQDDEGVQSEADSVDLKVTDRFGKAIIVAGGDYSLNMSYTNRLANEVYSALMNRLFEPEDVIYLNPVKGWNWIWPKVRVDDQEVTVDRLRRAILEDVADENVRRKVPLLIFLAGYGGAEGVFQLNETELLKGEDLGSWLDELNQRKVSERSLSGTSGIPPDEVIVVADVCYSRSFLQKVSGPGRVVIGSSSGQRTLVVGGASFARYFFQFLSKPYLDPQGWGRSKSLFECFEEARVQVQGLFPNAPYIDLDGDGEPLLDLNGNFVPSERENEQIARRIQIGGPVDLHLAVEPVIYGAEPIDLGEGSYRFEVAADPGLEGLSVVYVILADDEIDELPESGSSGTGVLAAVGTRGDTTIYAAEHTFEIPGRYTVLLLGRTDAGDFAGQRQIQIQLAPLMVGDFNNDGTVGFQDFILFAQIYGKGSEDPEWDAVYDLDGSNKIDFRDFLMFAAAYGT
jgi:hypothetical protein